MENRELKTSQNDAFLLNCQKANSGIGFIIAANIIAALPLLIGIIGYAVTPDDYRVMNPVFVLASFASITFCLSGPLTIAYTKLWTTKDDAIAIFILWLPVIPTFILSLLAVVFFSIIGFFILIPSAIAMIIMTMILLSKREQFNKKIYDLKTDKSNS